MLRRTIGCSGTVLVPLILLVSNSPGATETEHPYATIAEAI